MDRNDGSDDRWKDGVEKTLDKLDGRLVAVEGFQKWQIGAAGVIMFIVGFVSDKLKTLLGLH